MQAFLLQCLSTHHGGSVYEGALADYNDGENNDVDNNDVDGGNDEKSDGGEEKSIRRWET